MTDDIKKAMVEDYVSKTEAEFKDGANGSDVNFWSPTIGEHLLKIIPIRGTLDWCIVRARHYNVGKDFNESVLCPESIGKGKCPICELRRTLYDQAKEASTAEEKDAIRAEAKFLWPSKRYFACVYNFQLKKVVMMSFGAGVYRDISRLHKPKELEEFPEYLERLTGGITLSSIAKDLVSLEPGVGYKILLTKTPKANAKDEKRDVEYTVQIADPITKEEAERISAQEIPDIRSIMTDVYPYESIQAAMEGKTLDEDVKDMKEVDDSGGSKDSISKGQDRGSEDKAIESKSEEKQKSVVYSQPQETIKTSSARKPKCFGTKEFEPEDEQCKECEFNKECGGLASGAVAKKEEKQDAIKESKTPNISEQKNLQQIMKERIAEMIAKKKAEENKK